VDLPGILFVVRWLVRDTFRQALAARTFWLMLSVSALCIVFCLSVHIENGESLRPPGEIELFGGDKQPLTGPNPNPGHMTLGFGLARLALFRDAEAEVHLLQALLGLWAAGTVGMLIVLVWTAGFLPAFLDPASATVLLAKPVPRWLLLAGKCVGVVAFVGFQEVVFFGGTWFALGVRTGVWSRAYLLCIPLLMLHFATIYSFSVLLAVCTRSSVACIFGSIAFWFVCFGMNYGHHAIAALPYLDPNVAPFSTRTTAMANAGYWLLPKPGDQLILLDEALHGDADFDVLPPVFRIFRAKGNFQPRLSCMSSLLFAVLLLGLSAGQLRKTDY